MNIGNALEAPEEGAWGVRIKSEDFAIIASAGFDFVRLPVAWSTRAGADSPFPLDSQFLKRLDEVITQALSENLRVLIDVHHFKEAFVNGGNQRDRLISIWRQLALHFRGRDSRIYFELLNEPRGYLTTERWSEWQDLLIRAIRDVDSNRVLVIGGALSGSIAGLDGLRISEPANVILTFHYYEPMQFTHQGVHWAKAAHAWMGTQWRGSTAEKERVRADFARVARFAKANQIETVLLGEFGTYRLADIESRARWTCFVRRVAEENGFAWAYWEFRAGFGAYNASQGAWNQQLLDALIDGGKKPC